MSDEKEFSLNEKIKEFRESLKLNQTEFGNAIGVSRGNISRVESGERNGSLKLLRRIEAIFPEFNDSTENTWVPVNKFNLSKYTAESIPILAVLDYRGSGNGRVIEKVNVYYSKDPIKFGEQNSPTGSGTLTGYYFTIPISRKILAPGIVTHCRPLPKLPEE